jgi:hypothetical protein
MDMYIYIYMYIRIYTTMYTFSYTYLFIFTYLVLDQLDVSKAKVASIVREIRPNTWNEVRTCVYFHR